MLLPHRYYFNEALKKSAWEPPEGAQVHYMSPSQGEGASASSSNGAMVLLVSLAPILLVLGVLYFLYLQASKEGLADLLKNIKTKRDRSQKRKGTKAGSKFKQKFKLSQDGKGGRSANS